VAQVPLDPSILKVSPGFADAVTKSQLPPQQRNMVEQMSMTYVKANKLLKISEEKARKEFLDLDPIVQQNIRTLYPTQKRFEAEQNLLGKAAQFVSGGITGAVKGLFTPVIAGFKAAETLGKVANTGANVFQQTAYQDKPFTKKVLTDSYNGKNQWRWEDVTAYEKKYGKALVTLARGSLEFKTPGESIDMYGGVIDDAMFSALQLQANEPNKFSKLLEEIKQGAQLSPGRNLAQPQTTVGGNPNSWAVKVAKKLGVDVTTTEGQVKASKLVSGPVDAIYQILNPADPLNWIGVGPIIKPLVKGVDGIKVGPLEALQFGGFKNRGERLAQQYKFIAERGGDMGIKEATRFVFEQPDVAKLWDDELGPIVQRFADAPTKAEKGLVYRAIREQFPDWANESVVKELADAKAFNAPSAQRFFQTAENGKYLLSLRVDGTDFYRSGIPVARRTRKLAAVMQQDINKRLFGDLTGDDIKTLDMSAKEAVDKLKLTAAEDDSLLSPMLSEINRLNKEMDTTVARARRMASRAPGRILYGPNAIDTINEVRNLLHVVGFPRHWSDVMAEHFVDETVEYQVTMIRNLYAAFYKKIGMGGQTNGDSHIAELLNSTFNEKTGMTSLARVEIPQGWEVDLPRAIYKYDNDVPIMTSRGIIHPAQIAEGIAPINFDMAFEYAAMDKFSDKINFMKNLGGVTRNIAVRKVTNFWSTYTLFPRLGTRSAIDEAVFGAMTMPLDDLMKLATAPVNATGAQIKAATAVTGSSAGIGMYKRGIYKMFPHLDPRKKIPAEARREIIQKLAGDGPVGNVLHAEIMNSTVDRAISFYAGTVPKETWEAVRLVMKHNPQMLDSVAQSLGAKASMSGKVDVDYIDSMFTGNAWDRFFQEMGLKKSKIYTPRELSKMKEKERAMAFYDNWMMRFGFNGQKVEPGVYVNPTPFFFANNGLRDAKDLTKARRDMLEQVGVRYDEETGLLAPRKNSELVKKFVSPYSTTAYYRQQGLSDIDIADAIITNMLLDMKTTFHGTTNGFNSTLFDLISKKRSEILKEAQAKNQTPFDTWSKAVEVTEFKEFEEATLGMIPSSGEVNTRLVNIADGEFDAKSFEEFTGIDGFLERYQNWAMDVMDAQVTGLYRQKMLWITLERNLKELKPFQANIAKDHFDNLMAMTPNRSPSFEARAKTQSAELAEKQVVELAWTDATNTLLKYVDNPAVRSNLAVSVRSVGRFYRATEDFYRRVWRLYTKAPLRTLYRMRLIHQGLEANGEVYTDNKGDDYIIFPTDGIINNVVEPVVRTFTGNNNFQIPQFNDLALKLRLINPSFSPDAGQPSLSGPIAAVSMLAIKNLLRELPFVPSSIKETIKPGTNAAADAIDTIALGNIGASLDLQRAITPMFFQGIFNTLSPSEKDRQKVSAGLQAISYLEAFGNGAPRQKDYIGREDEYVRAQSKYLKNLRIATNVIVGFRNFTGQISPGQPSLRETASLPDYLKQVGIMSPNAQFWDLYNGILKNEGTNAGNAWDLALATFVGKNPGKSAFLAPRNNKEYKVYVNKTENVKKWSVANSKFVEDYKEAAWLFAPKVGDYNPEVYGWMTSVGLVTIPKFEEYLDQVQLAVDKDTYFKIKENETEKLKTTNDTTLRKLIVAESQRDRTALLTANPLLAAEIEGKLEGKGGLTNRLFNLNAAVRDPKAPISKELRATFRYALDEINSFVAFANDNDNKDAYDYSGNKASAKARVQAILDDLSKSVPEIKEANRLILTPLLNSYSRDIISAGPKG
jgi:hypothetical protein